MLGPLGECKVACDTLTFSGPSSPVGETTSPWEMVHQQHKEVMPLRFQVNSDNENKCWAFPERQACYGVGWLENDASVSRTTRTEIERTWRGPWVGIPAQTRGAYIFRTHWLKKKWKRKLHIEVKRLGPWDWIKIMNASDCEGFWNSFSTFSSKPC